jgi:hypothetical protein
MRLRKQWAAIALAVIGVPATASAVTDTYNITVEAGGIIKAFSGATVALTVPWNATTARITVQRDSATVTVNGQNTSIPMTASIVVPLNVGENRIGRLFSGFPPTDDFRITRPVEPNATLSALSVGAGPVNPPFSSGNPSYTVSVPSGMASTTITAAPTDPTSKMTFNGATLTPGTPFMVPIAPATPIEIRVTSSDGAKIVTYTVNPMIQPTAQPSHNAGIGSLQAAETTLAQVNPMFFTATVANATSQLTLTARAADAGASVAFNGGAKSIGSATSIIPLIVGQNSIQITITAADGSSMQNFVAAITRNP